MKLASKLLVVLSLGGLASYALAEDGKAHPKCWKKDATGKATNEEIAGATAENCDKAPHHGWWGVHTDKAAAAPATPKKK